MLNGKKIVLRSLHHSDLYFLDNIENNPENWQFGGEKRKYTSKELASYIKNATTDILIAKQYRFIIDLKGVPIGIIDLFDFTLNSVGVGIIIIESYRKKGFASEALDLVVDYVFSTLGVKKVYASVAKDNLASIKLFHTCDFQLQKENKDLQYFIKLAANQLWKY